MTESAVKHPALQAVEANLASVADELHGALDRCVQAVAQFAVDNGTAGQADLSATDDSAMHEARQHLHRCAAALDTVGLVAPATTLRALEAALQHLLLKPELATAASTETVRTGAHAVLEYLSRLMRQKPVPVLALYPTYRDWQDLAGAARAHPADLWEQVHVDVALPAAKAYEPSPALRLHLERLVLQVVKSLNPQAAGRLVRISGGLARAAEDLAQRRFWVAAAAYFEAVALGRLPDEGYVKRAASSVLRQYSLLLQGNTQSLTAHTHDLLFLSAHVVPDPGASDQVYLQAVWAAHDWRVADAWGLAQGQSGQAQGIWASADALLVQGPWLPLSVAAAATPLPPPQPPLRPDPPLLQEVVEVPQTRAEIPVLNDVHTLRHSFRDMGVKLERLGSQLRDLERQTDMQMQAHEVQNHACGSRLDPLEFDHYTRVRDMTGLLAVSFNDVVAVQHQLQRLVESAESKLAAQARQTIELPLHNSKVAVGPVQMERLSPLLERLLGKGLEVTEMAGLDEVRKEVLGLGGCIEVVQTEGGGTALRLLLPLAPP